MIVLDLSQEQLAAVSNTNVNTASNNSILSDIIQATGIMPSDDTEIVEGNDTEKNICGARMQDEDISNSSEVENDISSSLEVSSSSTKSASKEYTVNSSSRHCLDDGNEFSTNESNPSRQQIAISRPKRLERKNGK